MNIELRWSQPVRLLKARTNQRLFEPPDLDQIPRTPGVYLFARRSGDSFAPIYIGKADRLRRRVRQQLNNLRLMLGLADAPGRSRFLIYAEYTGRTGPRASRAIKIAERALIEYSLAQGHELINQQGTKRPQHNISNIGNRSGRHGLPRRMAAPRN